MRNERGKRPSRKSVITISCCCVLIIALMALNAAFSHDFIYERYVRRQLEETGVSYTLVEIGNRQLAVELASSGTGRCTLEDVMAIETIYETVYGDTLIGKLDGLSISIYDTEGEQIYDISKPMDTQKLRLVSVSEKIGDEDTLAAVMHLLEQSPFEYNGMDFYTARKTDGWKLELQLTADSPSFDELQTLYRSLENSCIADMCSIRVDSKEECLLYIAGDFRYGCYISWISPELQEQLMP